MQHASLVVEIANHLASFVVRADYQTERTVAVHVVVTALGIIFDYENDCVAAEHAFGDRFDHLSQRKVIIGDLCLRSGGPAGMVIGQIKEMEGRPISAHL